MRSTSGIGSRCLRNFASGIAVASLALIYQPVKIEGNSKIPLLSNHEAIVIDRLVYHFEPIRRGDVVVFRYPLDATKSYIKPTTINGFPVQLPGVFAQFAGTGGLPFGGPQNVLQLLHDMSWTKGKHNVRFGGLYDYQQINRSYGAFGQAIEQLSAASPGAFDNFLTGNLSLFTVAINPQGEFPCHTDRPNRAQFLAGALVVRACRWPADPVPDGAIADRNFHTQVVAMVTAITPTNTNSLECTKLLFLEDFAQ